MGANRINQACEYLRKPVETYTKEQVNLCILSNLSDLKISIAKATIYNIDPGLGKRIEEASLFAQIDPDRAVTNNKGVMNGIDAVVIATGNDWRAVEAGIHAYAALSGQYTSITRWEMKDGNLHGLLKAPIHVGTVGGVTRLHRIAKLSLELLGVTNSCELSRIIAAVGLVQNLAALHALVSDGIVKGHMKLHINNLVLAVGAQDHERCQLKQLLFAKLEQTQHVSESDAAYYLSMLRNQ